MANLVEVLVTCDSNNTLWTSSVWDPNTGTNLMTYRGGGTAESKTLSFIGNDYLAAVERTKPVLHIWPLNSHQTVQGIRFILPGRARALAFTQDGSYCAAGVDEKIYIWQVASGNLMTILNRHYQKVVLIKFTPDGRFFVSAAEDGMVMVWSLATVIAHPEVDHMTQTMAGQHDPIYIISDHSFPVADICISKMGMHGRMCTVSNDRSCKIYDLSTRELLLNVVFDIALSSVVMDCLELNVFVGTVEGNIHQLSLTNVSRNRDVLINTEKDCPTFSYHTKSVTCLSVSLDGETLMSGSDDEQVILWHIPSKQPVKTIKHKGSITNAFFTTNFPAIYKQDFSPSVILHSLERSVEMDNEEEIEVEILVNKKIDFWSEPQEGVIESSAMNEIDMEYRKKEADLKQEIDKLKMINSKLYEFSINKSINAVLSNEMQSVDGTNKKDIKKKKWKKKNNN